jgi:hypothetical protein
MLWRAVAPRATPVTEATHVGLVSASTDAERALSVRGMSRNTDVTAKIY